MLQEYFYNGNLRWTLFWGNPNYWAAFLGCAMPWLWWLGMVVCDKVKSRLHRILLMSLVYVGELAIWFLIIKTYSRGGLLSIILTLAAFYGLWQSTSMTIPKRIWQIGVRVVAIVILCFFVGFSGRMAPSYVTQDRSVLNRLSIWQGALAMTGDSPINGWGFKQGGLAYVNWYQPLDHTERPTGFVNSYLEVAVEFGTPALMAVIFCLCTAFLIALRQRKCLWVVTAASSLLCWALANFWSSMWSDPFLWVLPGIAILCIVVSACRLRRSLHRVALHSLAATVIIALVFIGTGSLIAKKYPYKVAPEAGGDAARIAVRNGSAISSGKAWEIWIDSAVFGPYWGRTLRNIINDDQPGEIVVHAPWSSAKAQDMPQAQTSICAGFQAELFLNGKQQFGRAILLHPAMFPAEQDTHASNYDKITVCLPKTDVSEYNYPWRLWAKRHNARLLFSPGSAARIEPGENTTFWRELFFDE